MRSSGVSLYQLLPAVLIFGVAITGLSLYVSHQLKPWGFKTLSATLYQIARNKSTAGLEAGVFNQLGSLILYADEVEQENGKLKGILIHDKRNELDDRIITAEEGQLLSDDVNQTITIHLEKGEIHEENDGKYTITRYEENDLITPAEDLYGDTKKRRRRSRELYCCLLYTSPSPRDATLSRMPSSA